MSSEIIFSVEEDPEGGYVAEALGHAIVTQADSMEELRAMSVTPFAVTSTKAPVLRLFASTRCAMRSSPLESAA